MNDNAISFSKGKLMIRLSLHDILISLLVITSLSFYDIKLIFLGLQFLAFAYAFARVVQIGMRTNAIKYMFWLVLFCGYGLCSLIWSSPANGTGITVTLSVVQVGLICYCILDYCVDIIHLNRVIWSFLAACVLLCVRFIISVPIELWGQGDRLPKETIFGSNTPAMVLAYGAVIALWMLLEKEHTKSKRFALILGMVAFMFVSMMAGTRKGIIAFLVALTVLILMRAKKPIEVLEKIILVALIIVAAYIAIMKIPMLYGSVGYRFETMISGIMGGEADKSAAARSLMLKDAWQVFLKNPIFGVGQDGYRYLNPSTLTYSHNNYVELLANLGVIGFVIFYGLYIWLFKQCLNLRKSATLPICFLAILMIVDWASVGYNIESTYVLLGISLGVIECLRQEEVKGL